MKVSIITVSYNSEITIEDTIQSVLSQDYPSVEYIIVDGMSTDKTVSIIEKYKNRISKFISEQDKGIYDGMNKGLELAGGEVIGILNSDDVFASETVVSEVVDCFRNQNAEGVYGDLVYVTSDLKKVVRYWKSGEYKEGSFLKGWMPPHPTFYVKKKIYKKFGGFNLKLKSAADYELMLRFIHKEKIKTAYLPKVLIKMRTGGQSNVSLINRILANREDKLAWKINGLKPGLLTLILKPLSKINQFYKR